MAGEEKQIVVEETTVVPGKMEFRLISPTESNFLKHIEWNKEELLAAVRSKVALYEGIVYTEETVKTAKNDRAELNNLVKAIDERRKKVKEVINQPYAEFEKELKEITDLIKKQSAEIDEQVKAFETAEKEEKRAKIMEAYEKAVGNLAEILPFSKVFDQRYLNKTYRKVESYFSDKAIHEKEKNEQFKKVMDQVNMYPSWHQQSIEIQQQFNKSIAELKEGMDQHQKQLEKIEEDIISRERSKLRDRLLQSHRYFTSPEKNPLHAWSEMEADAFWSMFKEYENAKGNGHMHTVVQPEMRALEVIPMHEDAKIAELMGSRK